MSDSTSTEIGLVRLDQRRHRCSGAAHPQCRLEVRARGRTPVAMAPACALTLLAGALAALGAEAAVDVAGMAPVMTPAQLTAAVVGAIVRVRALCKC